MNLLRRSVLQDVPRMAPRVPPPQLRRPPREMDRPGGGAVTVKPLVNPIPAPKGDEVNIIKRARRALGIPPITARNVLGLARRAPGPVGVIAGVAYGATAQRPTISTGGVMQQFWQPGPPGPPVQIPEPGIGGWVRRTLPGGRSGMITLPGVPAAPTPGVQGALQRWIPGGKTGYESQPQIIVSPEMVERASCPKGYVAVSFDDGAGGKVTACVYKPYARAMKWWRPRPKPPVSGWDQRAIRRAAGAKKRVKKLASSVGLTATERGRGRAKSCGHKGRCKCK